MTTRRNQQTGQTEVQDEWGEWHPVDTTALEAQTTPGLPDDRPPQARQQQGGGIPHVPTWDPRTNGEALLSETWLPNIAARSVNSGIDLLNQAGNWLAAPVGGSRQEAQVAAPVEAETPELQINDEYLPQDQALIDELESLRSDLDTSQPLAAPQLPAAPQLQEDAGLRMLLERAERRDSQTDAWIAEERAYINQRRERANNKWLMWGQFFSEWGASGRIQDAGVVMQRVLQRNQDMQDQLHQETRALMALGMQSDDAVTTATANLMSGRSQLANQNLMANYQRDVQQAGIDADYARVNADRSTRTAAARGDLAVRIAELRGNAQQRAQSRETEVATMLAEDPEYQSQAFGAIADNYSDDPATQGALTRSMQERAAHQGLMAYIAANQSSRNTGEVLRFLRQWDPRLTSNEVRNTPPDQLFRRLAQTPNARSAFQRNAGRLAEAARFAPAPAQ